MKSIHFICRREGARLTGLTYDKATKEHQSVAWTVSQEDAAALVGGKLYLHPTKDKGATIGGTVTGWFVIDGGERVGFKFRSEMEARNVAWRGMKHTMAWTSGLVQSET